LLDGLFGVFDKGLRTVGAQAHSRRAHPDAAIAESTLESADKSHIAALMRINHSGEVCAQALYHGQSFTSRNPATVAALQQASAEETEHLAWCEKRIADLGGRKSVLNPLWYVGSFALGSVAGTLGDKWNLGFLAETERQVGQHLKSHIDQLPEQDDKSRAILEQMHQDETHHAETAVQHGGADLPKPVKAIMALMSKAMTRTTYFL
jgi:ubiquinone biosynthesis monooxygenase Coq7